ncbi:NADP-dependent oxidoreductase [Amycolatopsis cihanbeyliensis]|uniref:NADPH:quinone reductase-like Zn-dependent oxidoreductase n=1 Tax=Amycolatopsis cihanbeyliensis TaxID=1128664 RepID=A0A542DRW2_AMYCI|nr:NADP-dependent oxidoreductase [Amycolatopsis cihanbeyliensis]TQJ05847.1 NADPH:quinone reductase-like Zn-dependent oxidoreductase [Amycolatopsis cihanbeyliensis]
MPKAARFSRYGGPEVLTLDEVPVPEPGQGQVRIAVAAAGMNAIDWKIRNGFFAGSEAPREPQGTGFDVAGTVEAIGQGVQAPPVGTAVFGKAATGAAATHTLADAGSLVTKPDWLSFPLAAGLPVVAETAYRTLRDLGLRAGHTLLIHAVAGGVGLMAAQLALSRGATVVGTASRGHHDFLTELGVRPLEYGEGLLERVRAAVDSVDLVLDAAGRDVLGLSVELTGDPDKVITIADADADAHGVRFSGGGPDAAPLDEVFAEVLPMLESGALRLPIQQTFPLERIADAHRRSEEGHGRGKIIIEVG